MRREQGHEVYEIGDVVNTDLAPFFRDDDQGRTDSTAAHCRGTIVELPDAQGDYLVMIDDECLRLASETGPEKFKSGAARDRRGGKGRFDLVSPIAIRRLAEHCEQGAVHYGDRNWEKGMPISRILDSAMRHLNQYREGRRNEPHLVSALWNLMAAVHVDEMVNRGLMPDDLRDCPNYVGEGPA